MSISFKDIEKQRQQKKANELKNYLVKEGFVVSNPNTSITDFGVSTYIYLIDKFNVNRKFRISDHSVTNIDRVFGEYHYRENSDINNLVKRVKDDIEETSKLVSKRKELSDLDDKRTIDADNKWDKIKSDFKDLCFKKNDRTYQNIEEFSKNKNRTNIYQRFIEKNRFGEDAFYYEWTEPKNQYELCKDKPSREFIENYVHKLKKDGVIVKLENGGEIKNEFNYTIGGL
jgi:hypothetical protein